MNAPSDAFLHHKLQALQSQADEFIAVRRDIHRHPEMGYKEYRTSDLVAQQLSAWGYQVTRGLGGTGLVGQLKKGTGERSIGIRADMDALPIDEATGLSYASCNVGIMHACGHDGHTAMLLAAAKHLAQHGQFSGTLNVIFQPAEEGLGGAKKMMEDGLFKQFPCNAIFAMHNMPGQPQGHLVLRDGSAMASSDNVTITLHGKGGHGAMPHLNIDPVLIAANIITSLQQIVSRNAQPIVPSVLSFGKVIANGATNIIPNEVYMEGTFRTLDEKWRAEAHAKMKKMAEGIAESMGGSCSFEIRKGYPFLKNDEALTGRAKQAAVQYMGVENVVDLDIWMAAEDFSYYSQEMPATFYRLGTRNEAKGIVSSLPNRLLR